LIKTFRDRDTKTIYGGHSVPRFRNIEKIAVRKLDQLDQARKLVDLGAIQGNRLERLRGDRLGQCSIRINDQYRICFVWKDNDAYEVEIVDYH